MLDDTILSSLEELPSPLLTLYVNTQPVASSSNRPAAAAYFTWLKQEANRLIANLSPSDERSLRRQISKIEKFLRGRIAKEKALVIFAGPKTWKLATLSVPLENELHWGKPALTQMIGIISENKSYCVVVLDHKGARFFRYRLGKMAEMSHQNFDFDASQWKRKDLGHVTGQGVHKRRGSQRDTYEHRKEAQYRRFCQITASRTNKLCQANACCAVFLVGPTRLIKFTEAGFPKEPACRLILINEDFGNLSPSELQRRLLRKIEEWRGRQELALVTELLDDERRTVIGIDETLAQLQKGKLRTVVLARQLGGIAHECTECGWIDRSADPVCRGCGREPHTVNLRDAIIDVARRTDTQIEFVNDAAADKLNRSGGMAGWLRGRIREELR
jgi:hypothetical protein